MRSYPSPAAEGFRALVSAPAAFVAELVWRSTFGVAALVIAVWSLNRFFNAITVSAADEFSLATGFPLLVMSAIRNIVGQMPAVLLKIASVLLPGMALLWVFASAAGRTVSTQRLLEFFAERYRFEAPERRLPVRTLLMLHFLRVAIGTAGVTGYLGALVIASYVARETRSTGTFLLVVISLEFVVVMIASWLNWIVSLGPIFAVRDERDWLGAIADSVMLSRRRAASFSSVAMWFGLIRVTLAASALVLALSALGMLGSVPGWVVLLVLVLIYAAYSIVSNALLTARLAAYVAIAQQEIAPDPEPKLRAAEPPAWLRPLPPALPPGEASA